jgi:hypothetical protein
MRHRARPGARNYRRLFARSQENEAYDLGAALLLPRERIEVDVRERPNLVREIADTHGHSEQPVTYRIKRMHLWDRYVGYAFRASYPALSGGDR